MTRRAADEPPRRGASAIRSSAIDTPALVIDLDAMERNLARDGRLRARAAACACARTRRCTSARRIARLQIAAGAVGVCVQKDGEAEALAAAGVADIYITNEVIDPAKLERVAALARRRCGSRSRSIRRSASSGSRRALRGGRHAGRRVRRDRRRPGPLRRRRRPRPARSRTRSSSNGLRFAGLQAYHGRAQHLRGADEREAAIAPRGGAGARRAGERRPRPASPARSSPAPAPAPSCSKSRSGVWGELQAGSYLFMDRDYADNEPRRPRRASSTRCSSRAR